VGKETTWKNLGEDGRITLKHIFKKLPYLNERQFETKINGENSSRFHIHSGVPQGNILGPLLYVLYTTDLPTSRESTLGTFTDDIAIFATHEDPTIASLNLQEHLEHLQHLQHFTRHRKMAKETENKG
jgi:hypothetical protein